MTSGQFVKLLQLVVEHDVEVIVVGMLAGVLQGVPLTTGDVDIVHRRTPEILSTKSKVVILERDDATRACPVAHSVAELAGSST